MENQYYSIKIKIQDDAEGIFILFSFILSISDRKVTDFSVVLSSLPVTADMPPTATWQDYVNRINYYRKKGDYLKGLSDKADLYLKKYLFSENFTEEALHYLEHEQDENLKILISKTFKQLTGSKNHSIEIFTSLAGESEISTTTLPVQETTPTEKPPIIEEIPVTFPEIPENARLAGFKFVVSPVSGKMAGDLVPGDQVLIKLDPANDVSKELIDTLNLKDETGDITPTTATVVACRPSGKASIVAVRINDQIFGKVTEEERSVRVKLASEAPVAKVKIPKPEKVEKKTGDDNSSELVKLAAIVFALVFIVIFIFKLLM